MKWKVSHSGHAQGTLIKDSREGHLSQYLKKDSMAASSFH